MSAEFEVKIAELRDEFNREISKTDRELREFSTEKSEKARNISIGVVGFVIAIISLTGALGFNALIGSMIEKRGIGLVNKRITSIETRIEEIAPKISEIDVSLLEAQKTLIVLKEETSNLENETSRAVEVQEVFKAALDDLRVSSAKSSQLLEQTIQSMEKSATALTDAVVSAKIEARIEEINQRLNEFQPTIDRSRRLIAEIEEIRSLKE